MSAAEEGNGQQGSLAVSTEILRRVSEARRAEAELERLTQRMRSARQGEHLLAGENERRMELLKVAGRSHVPQDIARQRRDLTVITIGDLLFPWQVINLPYMDEGIDQVPGVAGTSGDIATAGLYAGGLGYAGMLEDDDASPPFAEKWWIHNWRNSQVLPAAPYDGHLYYRFTVDSECHIYQAPVFSGSVREFVTIGWTSDVASDPLASWTNWQTVGWPVDETLPSSNRNLGGSVPVTGSIPVQAGRSAALGFIYGTIVSAASGYVQFLWGNFGTRVTLPPAATIDYRAYDKIEYRFEPAWWVKALDERLQLAG